MRMYALLILATGGLIAAGAAQYEPAKQDMKKLQGTWKTVASEVEGQKIEAADATATVMIKGDNYTVSTPPVKPGRRRPAR